MSVRGDPNEVINVSSTACEDELVAFKLVVVVAPMLVISAVVDVDVDVVVAVVAFAEIESDDDDDDDAAGV